MALALGGIAVAQSDTTAPPLGEGIDCTEVTVDYAHDPALTRAEQIVAMDRALDRSLSKFDACQTEAKNTSPDSGGGAAGGGIVSTAPSDMSGAETAPPAQSASRAYPELGGTAPTGGRTDGSWTDPPGPQAAPNGKIPEDIPPGNNDSVLEAQIRQAAMNESDPEIQVRLWNEYRRYKGLPSVE